MNVDIASRFDKEAYTLGKSVANGSVKGAHPVIVEGIHMGTSLNKDFSYFRFASKDNNLF